MCGLLPDDRDYGTALPLHPLKVCHTESSNESTEELNECLAARQRRPESGTAQIDEVTKELQKASALVDQTRTLDNIALEASFLDRALAIRSRLLHPLHVDVIAAHAALLSARMLNDDWKGGMLIFVLVPNHLCRLSSFESMLHIFC